jgi:YfiH family protein
MTQLPTVTSSLLSGLNHSFFGRKGGVSHSHPGFETLNVGLNKGDDDQNIIENRRRICQHFGLTLDHLVIVNQQHTDIAHIVDKPFKTAPLGDALVTTTPNLLLGIQTADCVPILFADSENQVIAAAHAGWRGSVKGIIEDTLDKMVKMGANRSTIKVALGPCIWQQSYEVGPDFIETMQSYPGAYQPQFFIKAERAHHFYFDLPGYVNHRLQQAGIQNIDSSPFDTFANPKESFSYRYKTVNHLPYIGQQLSVIVLKTPN